LAGLKTGATGSAACTPGTHLYVLDDIPTQGVTTIEVTSVFCP
jgi:hypothetical protein